MSRGLALSIFLLVSLTVSCAYGDCSYCQCYSSDFMGGNCTDSGCRFNCAGPTMVVRLPGFALQDGSNAVQWVAPGSPAGLAGLQPGDVVLTINGNSLPRPCEPYTGGSDLYVVRRKGSVVTLSIARLGMEDLIARAAWPILPAKSSASGATAGKRVPSHLYLSGMVLKHNRTAVIVKEIIPKRPAAEAGIQAEDLVLMEPARPTLALEGGDHAETVSFRVIHNGSAHGVTLRSRFAGDILAALAGRNAVSSPARNISSEE